MKLKSIFPISISLFISIIALFTACKKGFDAPPAYVTPTGISANLTIRDLKALYKGPAINYNLPDNIISGVVIGDDKSGNLYKQIIIQDSTGGIVVMLNGKNLYNDYMIGRTIYIKTKGLCLSDYYGVIELGIYDNQANAITQIPSSKFGDFIIKSTVNLNSVPTPKVVTLSQLIGTVQDPLQSTLIQLDGFEFKPADTSKTYANVAAGLSGSFNLVDCSNNTVTLYNSSFAYFAGLKVPNAHGSIVAIASSYKGSNQLIIRDTNDVKFYFNRCNGSILPPPPPKPAPLDSVRKLFTGTSVTLPTLLIKGIITSDQTTSHLSNSNLIIQDGDRAVDLYYSGGSVSGISVGDSVVVDISGGSLMIFGGALEIKLPTGAVSKITKVATGKVVTPKLYTLAQLTTAMNTNNPITGVSDVENTLVKVVGATASGSGSTYSGSLTLTDATGSITMYTRSAASYSGSTYPTTSKTWVGYVQNYNSSSLQFSIRNPSYDVY